MARALTALAVCLLGGCASGGVPAAGAEAATPVAAARTAVAEGDALLALERDAGEAYAEGRDSAAIPLFVELTRAVPAEPTYWYRLGNVLVRTARYDDAAVAYQHAVAREPGNARAWHNLGIVRMRQAQESFANGVKGATKGDAVFEDSLRLSTSLFSLTNHGFPGAADAPAMEPPARSAPASPSPAP